VFEFPDDVARGGSANDAIVNYCEFFAFDDFFVDDQVACGVLFALLSGFFEEVPAAESVFFDADFHWEVEFFTKAHGSGDGAVWDIEYGIDLVGEVAVFSCELSAEIIAKFVDADAFDDARSFCEVFVFEEAVFARWLADLLFVDCEVGINDECGSWFDVLDVVVAVLDECDGLRCDSKAIFANTGNAGSDAVRVSEDCEVIAVSGVDCCGDAVCAIELVDSFGDRIKDSISGACSCQFARKQAKDWFCIAAALQILEVFCELGVVADVAVVCECDRGLSCIEWLCVVFSAAADCFVADVANADCSGECAEGDGFKG